MSLPVDPTSIDPDAIGEHRAVLEMSHEDAIEHVRETFADVGMGFPQEFSPSDLLNEKVSEADRDPYYVLGACNPSVAHQALEESDLRIGGLFPCNVVIWEEEPGRQVVYHVSIMRIARLVGMAPDDGAWDDIIAETGALIEEAYGNLDSVE